MPKFYKQSMKLNWNFLQGGGVKTKKKFNGENMYIFWNHTFITLIELMIGLLHSHIIAADSLQVLQGIFPNILSDHLKMPLECANYNVEKAVDELLGQDKIDEVLSIPVFTTKGNSPTEGILLKFVKLLLSVIHW